MGNICVLGKSSFAPQAKCLCWLLCGSISLLLLICAAKCYLGILSSISDLREEVDVTKRDGPYEEQRPQLGCRTSAMCSSPAWDSKQGKSQTPTEWSQGAGTRQGSLQCCVWPQQQGLRRKVAKGSNHLYLNGWLLEEG